MKEIYWNVSKHGSHLFRTDKYVYGDLTRIEAELMRAFPTSGGYSIIRYERDSAWNVSEVVS